MSGSTKRVRKILCPGLKATDTREYVGNDVSSPEDFSLLQAFILSSIWACDLYLLLV